MPLRQAQGWGVRRWHDDCTRAGMALIEGLLNTLESERYMREALLLSVLDELASSDRFAPAFEAGRDLFARLEAGEIDDDEFASAIREVRSFVDR